MCACASLLHVFVWHYACEQLLVFLHGCVVCVLHVCVCSFQLLPGAADCYPAEAQQDGGQPCHEKGVAQAGSNVCVVNVCVCVCMCEFASVPVNCVLVCLSIEV